MKTRTWLIVSGSILLTALVILALVGGLSQAQGPEPEGEINDVSGVEEAAAVSDRIPIQGRLTDASGNPLNGTYSIRFRLYDVETGGTSLCSDINSVSVADGLFSSYMYGCHNDLYGQKVWLGVKVGSDVEMTPRQPIYPVPYALSLRPGAVISDSHDYVLTVRSTDSGTNDHDALMAYAEGDGEAVTANATDGTGIYSASENGYGIYGQSNTNVGIYGKSESGCGVSGYSNVGTAICAEGSGVIRSTADTEIAVSPLKMVPHYNGDVELRTDGAYMEVRANTSGYHYVYVPVDLPREIFGTPTRLSSARICYKCDYPTGYINATRVSYSTDSGIRENMIIDQTDRQNTGWQCYTITDSTPGEISGSLFIEFYLHFMSAGADRDIQIGNITLTLTE